VVAKWERQLDAVRLRKVLDQEPVPPLDEDGDPSGSELELDDRVGARA
jgi:hypothetical protein